MTGRQCGTCSLCCKLLPVRSLGKKDNERCRHQKAGKGCAVYAKLHTIAPECRVWSCRWLVDPGAAGLPRPDRCHYVIDIMPDFIVQERPEGPVRYPVIQVWVDPGFPDAHRDPHLRAWLITQNTMALIRVGAMDGFVLVPPELSGTGDWYEHRRSRRAEQYSTWPDGWREGMQEASRAINRRSPQP
jgi:hypothetical protein